MRWLRGVPFWLAVVGVIGMARCAGLLAQTPTHRPVYVAVVWWPARYALDSAWRADTVREAAWCVTMATTFAYPDTATADSIVRVYQVTPAAMTRRDPMGVDYPSCPHGEPELHTHPPQFGVTTCEPSRVDWETLERRRKRYGVVQCGRRSFHFYFASDP